MNINSGETPEAREVIAARIVESFATGGKEELEKLFVAVLLKLEVSAPFQRWSIDATNALQEFERSQEDFSAQGDAARRACLSTLVLLLSDKQLAVLDVMAGYFAAKIDKAS